MLLNQIFEQQGQFKTAVLGWGRGMGHKGHMLLAKAVLHHAKENSAKPFFVVSRTSLVDPGTGQPWTDKPTFTKTKDDPLTPDEKLNTYRKVFPQDAEVFSVATADATKLEQVIAKIAKEGFNKVILVVGEDQKTSMGYLTRPDKSGVPPYKQVGLDDLEIISRQDTTEPSSMRGSPEYQEGPRATPMRQVLTDPSKSEEEQFAVWRRDMPDNLSDDEVLELMRKAKQRMSMVPLGKNVKNIKEQGLAHPDKGVEEGNDPLQNRADYAKKHGQGQVYKKTYPGDKVGMTKAYAYDVKRTGPKGQLPKEDLRLDNKSKKTWSDYGMPDNEEDKPTEKHYHSWQEYEKDTKKKEEKNKQVPISENLQIKINHLVSLLESKHTK